MQSLPYLWYKDWRLPTCAAGVQGNKGYHPRFAFPLGWHMHHPLSKPLVNSGDHAATHRAHNCGEDAEKNSPYGNWCKVAWSIGWLPAFRNYKCSWWTRVGVRMMNHQKALTIQVPETSVTCLMRITLTSKHNHNHSYHHALSTVWILTWLYCPLCNDHKRIISFVFVN